MVARAAAVDVSPETEEWGQTRHGNSPAVECVTVPVRVVTSAVWRDVCTSYLVLGYVLSCLCLSRLEVGLQQATLITTLYLSGVENRKS